MHFRSGYLKEYVWARLLQCSLLVDDKLHLEKAALGYLQRRIDRAFWSMGRAMSRIASPGFWAQVEAVMETEDSAVRTRAGYLLAFRDGAQAGGLLRRKISDQVWTERYRATRNGSA